MQLQLPMHRLSLGESREQHSAPFPLQTTHTAAWDTGKAAVTRHHQSVRTGKHYFLENNLLHNHVLSSI